MTTHTNDPGLLADSLEQWEKLGRPGAIPTTHSTSPRPGAEAWRDAQVPIVTDRERRREKDRADRAEARVFESTVPADVLAAGEHAVGEWLTTNNRHWPRRRIILMAVRLAQHNEARA